MKKIESNVKRDRKENERLGSEGWAFLKFWKHEVRKESDKVVVEIMKYLGHNLGLR